MFVDDDHADDHDADDNDNCQFDQKEKGKERILLMKKKSDDDHQILSKFFPDRVE